jgi:hypothetical protein
MPPVSDYFVHYPVLRAVCVRACVCSHAPVCVPDGQARAGQMLAVSGPTTDQQPPFQWTPLFRKKPHQGQPLLFNFTWGMYDSVQ